MIWMGLYAFMIASTAATLGYLLSAALTAQRRTNLCCAYHLLDSAVESYLCRRRQEKSLSLANEADNQLKGLITALNKSRGLIEGDFREDPSKSILPHHPPFAINLFREVRHDDKGNDSGANLQRCSRGAQKGRHS